MDREHSAEKHLLRDQWRALSWFADHQLLGEDYWDEGRGARWVVGHPGTFTNRCEIFAGIGGSLIVHGDFEVVRFGHYSDHRDAFSRLCWMGMCRDVGYYVAQKASIGMGRWTDAHRYDEDVAKADLLAKARQEDDELPELAEILREAAQEATESRRDLEDFLSRRAGGRWDAWEWIGNFGRVLDSQVVIAHVALNKAASLLFEKHGDAGPPQCRREQKERAA